MENSCHCYHGLRTGLQTFQHSSHRGGSAAPALEPGQNATKEVLSHFQTRAERSCRSKGSSWDSLWGSEGGSHHLKSQLCWDQWAEEATCWHSTQQPSSASSWWPMRSHLGLHPEKPPHFCSPSWHPESRKDSDGQRGGVSFVLQATLWRKWL